MPYPVPRSCQIHCRSVGDMAHVHTVHPNTAHMPSYPTTLPQYPPTTLELFHARIRSRYDTLANRRFIHAHEPEQASSHSCYWHWMKSVGPYAYATLYYRRTLTFQSALSSDGGDQWEVHMNELPIGSLWRPRHHAQGMHA